MVSNALLDVKTTSLSFDWAVKAWPLITIFAHSFSFSSSLFVLEESKKGENNNQSLGKKKNFKEMIHVRDQSESQMFSKFRGKKIRRK